MKGGITCKCCKTWDEKLENWEITHYKCNYSAFESPKNGWHPSDYSDMKCKKCGAMWRTKANYVDKLKTEQKQYKTEKYFKGIREDK